MLRATIIILIAPLLHATGASAGEPLPTIPRAKAEKPSAAKTGPRAKTGDPAAAKIGAKVAPATSPATGTVAGITELDARVITASGTRPASSVPRAVTVIDRREIERQTPRVLSDLLRGEAGVSVQQTTGGQGTPIIRGLLGSAVLMLVDGIRLNTAFFRPAPNQYFALVDPYQVSRIEVIRGPGSAIYGGDALGGAVNLITGVPSFAGTRWGTRGRALVSFSSADTSWVTRIESELGKRGVGLRAGVTYQNHGDLRGGGSTGVQRPMGYDSVAADGKLAFSWGKHRLDLSAQYLRQPKTPRYDELVAGFGRTEPGAATFFFEPNDRLFLHGRYRLFPDSPIVDRLELNLSFQEINDDRRIQDFGSTEERRERNRSRMLGAALHLHSHWGKVMRFEWGAEAYFDRIDSARQSRDVETGLDGGSVPSRFANGATANTVGLYLHDEIRIHQRFRVTIAGRFNYFGVDVPEADRGVGSQLGLYELTGRLGLLYRVHRAVALVANVGRGVRPPNVFDLSTLGERPGNRYNIPNPNLGPEQVVGADAGVKVSFRGLRAEAFAFHASYQDKIEAIPTGEITPQGRAVVQSQNLSRVTLWGAEASWGARLLNHLDLYGSLTFTWGEERLPDGRVTPASRIPPFNGRLGLLARPHPKVWIDAAVRFATTQDRLSPRDLGDPRIDPRGTGGKVLADLRVGYKPLPSLQVRLSVENLFDQEFREHGSGFNVPGLNVTLALESRW